ncbi:MAG TPA: PhzF family phenazine biosynthesis protein [Holophagaceae bacterium]|nr:PhzF family phenazine biosynthesis protein [Holophagaceae bacterium]
MLEVDITLVNAFVDGEAGGNPAGVALEGDRYTAEERQRIAAAAGFPETAFVCGSASADARLVFHTPTRSIPHCGHATVAAFCELVASGRMTGPLRVNETVDGPRRIRIADDLVFLEQVSPRLEALASARREELLAALGIGAADLLPGFEPLRAFNGNGSILVPLRDEATLARLAPDMAALTALSEALEVVGGYVFVPREGGERQAVVRMFAPAYGIPEEAATGMMAGPLGYWLSKVLGMPGSRFLLEQGRLMRPASPSLLQVELEGEVVWVGGRAKAVRRMKVSV